MKHKGFVILALMTAYAALSVSAVSCGKDSDPSDETHSYSLSQGRSPKRGVAQDSWAFPDTDIASLSSTLSWTYNWGSGPLSAGLKSNLAAVGVEFCPMAWNNNYNEAGLRAADEWILGFNEPNLTDQCNMTPQEAAKYWPDVVSIAKAAGKKLVSPAMNYGTLENYHDPIVWLDEFFEQPGCSLDDIDAIAVHCYMPSAGNVKDFIERFRKYGKPIWLTEFCNGNGNNISESSQLAYMCETLNMLEQNDLVGRYAWFMGRSGRFNSRWHNSLLENVSPFGLTSLGKVFAGFSTFDSSVVYGTTDVIPAEQYFSCEGKFHLEPSTDGGILDVIDFKAGSEMRYKISLPKAGTYTFKLRYQTYMPSDISFGAAGSLDSYTLQNTASKWITESFELQLPAGNSELVLKAGGNAGIKINWMMIQ